MRDDNIGIFWEDVQATKGARNIIRTMPEIPDTGWKKPTYFPDLSTARRIAIDTETYDPELLDKGPGWARGKGHIVGVSVGVDGGYKWYFPIRHEVMPEDNLPPEVVLSWLKDTLANPNQPKIGANIMYDVGWLRHEGVRVAGELVDVQYAEALLSETAQVALEILGQKYLREGKESNLLYNWCADFYGGPATSSQRANIYRAPPKLVGPYAESDADLPLRIILKQYPLLVEEGMVDLFAMECGLINLLVEMRYAGVTVNIPKAEQLREELLKREQLEQEKLNNIVGFKLDINSKEHLVKAFDALGIPYSRTAPTAAFPNGQASFTKAYLEGLEHPIGKVIKEKRKLEKLRGTFLESYILNSHINGKVYGQFHPLRNDDGGTRSGRFSSSTPNLQNLPARDEELAPMVRGIFIPDYGHEAWRKHDYSQIEYRFLAHFAVGPKADDVRQQYVDDPDTDYHEMTLDMVSPVAHWDISTPAFRKQRRRPIKNINFGLIYGMGVDKLAGDLGLTVKQGKELFSAYHSAVPFAKATMDAASEEASLTGAITTILGRKSRFDLWEPKKWMGNDSKIIPLPLELAIRAYGNVRRAMTHKALNRRLQGSAADLIKKAMLRCWKEGIYDRIGVPRLQVHDETNHSDPGNVDDGFREMQHIFETAIMLRVPVKFEGEIGPDWGHTKSI